MNPFGTLQERSEYESWAAENRRVCGRQDMRDGKMKPPRGQSSTAYKRFRTDEARKEYFDELETANLDAVYEKTFGEGRDFLTAMGYDEIIQDRKIVDYER